MRLKMTTVTTRIKNDDDGNINDDDNDDNDDNDGNINDRTMLMQSMMLTIIMT